MATVIDFAHLATNSSPLQWDGKISIEHQLEIHVEDLLAADESVVAEKTTEVVKISVADVLNGLKYVMDYRIKGGRQPHLNLDICQKLVRVLLTLTGKRDRKFPLGRKPTAEAEMAFALFADFLGQVEEFRQAVGLVPVDELRRRLLLNLRILSPSTPYQFNAAIFTLKLLTTRFRQFCDWGDLVKRSDGDQAELLEMLKIGGFYRELDSAFAAKPVHCFPPQSLYFDRGAERVLDMFASSIEKGLASSQYLLHKTHYGDNLLPRPSHKPWYRILWDQVCDFMIAILCLAIVGSIVLEFPNFSSAVVLGLVVIFNISIGFWQELKALRTIRSMQTLQVPQARVVRDGVEMMLDTVDLVPGDIVCLSEGDMVPADVRLLAVNRLEVIEASLTGESEPVAKSVEPIRVKSRKLPLQKCRGNAFMSTVVAKGTGRGLVVRIGASTEVGKISQALGSEGWLERGKQSPLQKKMAALGRFLIATAAVLCFIVAVAGISWGRAAKDMIRVAVRYDVHLVDMFRR